MLELGIRIVEIRWSSVRWNEAKVASVGWDLIVSVETKISHQIKSLLTIESRGYRRLEIGRERAEALLKSLVLLLRLLQLLRLNLLLLMEVL